MAPSSSSGCRDGYRYIEVGEPSFVTRGSVVTRGWGTMPLCCCFFCLFLFLSAYRLAPTEEWLQIVAKWQVNKAPAFWADCQKGEPQGTRKYTLGRSGRDGNLGKGLHKVIYVLRDMNDNISVMLRMELE